MPPSPKTNSQPATYRAVVKYALDASDDEKRKALKQGISEIAMELVAEHDLDAEDLERVWEDALGDAEIEMKAQRDV
jgi:hypothetical protein